MMKTDINECGLAAVALFVLMYGQPTLRQKFGADYEEYCKNVRA
jgi:protein-S-isoprenylcysteine O-methyltransferase Ste14